MVDLPDICSVFPDGSRHILASKDGGLETEFEFKNRRWHIPGNRYGTSGAIMQQCRWQYVGPVEEGKANG